MKKIIAAVTMFLCLSASYSFGTNLANPTAPISEGRFSVGVSYFAGGLTITNADIPMSQDRLGTRVSYALLDYINFGLDFGLVKVGVERHTQNWDTIPAFKSDVGWSLGGHLKVFSPYMFDRVSFFGLANGNFFSAKDDCLTHRGNEGVGVIGAQVRIPNFGYISAGPQVHLIFGESENKSSTLVGNNISRYSNTDNIRAWFAIDYFPSFDYFTRNDLNSSDERYFMTFEFAMSPEVLSSRRMSMKHISLALSLGIITKRLYGEDR